MYISSLYGIYCTAAGCILFAVRLDIPESGKPYEFISILLEFVFFWKFIENLTLKGNECKCRFLNFIVFQVIV